MEHGNLTDDDVIPFGKKYEGIKLANVPNSYLKFIYEEGYNIPAHLKKYIEDNWEVIKNG